MFFIVENDNCICNYFTTPEQMILRAVSMSKLLGWNPKDITFCKIVTLEGELRLHDLRDVMSKLYNKYLPGYSTFCKK